MALFAKDEPRSLPPAFAPSQHGYKMGPARSRLGDTNCCIQAEFLFFYTWAVESGEAKVKRKQDDFYMLIPKMKHEALD